MYSEIELNFFLAEIEDASKLGYVTHSALRKRNTSLEILSPLQDLFLMENEGLISKKYKSKWPIEKLYWWSRSQEYGFILYMLINKLRLNKEAKVLDFGPGCSFMPYVLREVMGIKEIHIEDIDSDVNDFWREVGKKIGLKVYCSDESNEKDSILFDVIYSVSVVEHIPDPVNAIKDLIDRLKVGGSIFLTMDIDRASIGNYGLTITQLNEIFEIPNISFHAMNIVEGIPHLYDVATPAKNWWIDSRDSKNENKFRRLLNLGKTKLLKNNEEEKSRNISVIKIAATKIK